MQNRSFRYKDAPFPSYGKTTKPTPPPPTPQQQAPAAQKNHSFPISFDKLKNLSTDDYILIFLIFMLIKDNENPDWPLIMSLGYILFDF